MKWIGAAHWTAGRAGTGVDLIVLHWMAGTLASTDATFLAGVRQASAHYGVEDTTVHGYVRELNTAWALGNWPANLRSISIEISAQPGRDATPATIATVVDLVTDLCRRHGLTAAAIGRHKDYSPTQCPGTVPVEAIRAAVAANLSNDTTEEEDTVTPEQMHELKVFTQRAVNHALDIQVADNRAQIAALGNQLGKQLQIDESELAAALLAQGEVTIAKVDLL